MNQAVPLNFTALLSKIWGPPHIAIAAANAGWNGALDNITNTLCGTVELSHASPANQDTICTIAEVRRRLAELPSLIADSGVINGDAGDLFEDAADE